MNYRITFTADTVATTTLRCTGGNGVASKILKKLSYFGRITPGGKVIGCAVAFHCAELEVARK